MLYPDHIVLRSPYLHICFQACTAQTYFPDLLHEYNFQLLCQYHTLPVSGPHISVQEHTAPYHFHHRQVPAYIPCPFADHNVYLHD